MAESLRATLPLEARGPAGAFILTDEQVATLGGGRKTFPVTVTVTVNGVGLPLRLARMGGENMIGLAKAKAKRDETRAGRVAKTVEMVRAGRTLCGGPLGRMGSDHRSKPDRGPTLKP